MHPGHGRVVEAILGGHQQLTGYVAPHREELGTSSSCGLGSWQANTASGVLNVRPYEPVPTNRLRDGMLPLRGTGTGRSSSHGTHVYIICDSEPPAYINVYGKESNGKRMVE